MLLTLTIIIVALALVFDFINGFHDKANEIATIISTRALKPTQAVIFSSIMNLIGAMSFTGVAKTVSDKIVHTADLPDNGTIVILAALISAIFWNLLTWWIGMPSSSSHTLLGSIAGAGIASSGFGIMNVEGFKEIIEGLLASPVIAFLIGFILFKIFKRFLKNQNLVKTNNHFRKVQIATAALQSYSHGTNDAQKSMGIITMALIAANYQDPGTDVHFWVQLSCAIAMGLGTAIGGWKIIETVGSKIMKIRPVDGVAADLSSAGIIFGATLIHLPVSTTHVVSSSILGVGFSHRKRGVNWSTAQSMIITWFITIPISAVVAGLFYLVLNSFL
ncbi:MAG: pit [Bacillales bacterium]|jgi:PiT family inorganic phosphate transporter|nr:pit [Bacillales bacterium]